MSWRITADRVLVVARRVCTPRQIEVVERRALGQSWRSIGLAMGIDESAARGLEERAARKILAAIAGEEEEEEA